MILLKLDRMLAGYDRRYRRRLFGILALSVVQTLLVVLRPLPIKFLIDTPQPGTWLGGLKAWAGSPERYLLAFVGLILAIELLIFGFRLGAEIGSTRLSERLIRRLRATIAANLLDGPYADVAKVGVGRVLAAVVGDVEVIQRLIKDVAVSATLALFQLALMLGVIAVLQPALLWILGTEMALLAGLIAAYATWRKRAFLAQMGNQERYLGWVSALYGKNLDLRFNPARALFLDRTIGLGRRLYRAGMRLWVAQSVYYTTVDLFMGLASAACLVFLFVNAGPGASTGVGVTGGQVGNLLVFLYYSVFIFPCLSKIGEAAPLLIDARNAYDRLGALVGLAEPPHPPPERHPAGTRLGRIEFRGVGLRAESGDWLLRHLSFRIEPGERVALFGDSGTGKSTILGLILGLIAPDEGEVLVDGRPAGSLSAAERKRLFLFQRSQPAFFPGTVADIVTLGRSLDPVTLAAVLADVRLADRLAAVEGGVLSPVGERGEPFSQGEQQRLAFTRVLLDTRPIVLLDETLNSLDEALEQAIVAILLARRDGRTLIMITHRRSVAEQVDRFFYLRQGGVLAISERAESGPSAVHPPVRGVTPGHA